ncbi:MAG: hypothetical protein sL5_08500 [Candidatus Mesenet longicola]|uniref:Uncharacterized protein n=1 Tax=Candidatus Mesenet longicola TaxID=1892558 RepID=A0A8J3HV59_9RICK|nr:MAG: hypothetical protein sGL2_09110 [Candidatus Mesenet longicola]GHM59857.1 MAG: hypothetical protein sL5_08500 [Candidatus Mesenet longicola]
MSTKQYNSMIKEYFSNNNKGFNAPYEVSFPELNIKVEVYSHNLKPNKIAQMESDTREVVKNFQNISNLKSSGSEKILKVYIFDDQADYKHLGSKFGFGLGDEGGKTYYRGEQGVFADMYVYQAGGIHNFKHELAHGLTYVATGGKSLPTVLMEGVADYIEHSSDQNFNTREGFSIDEAERAIGTRDLSIDSILKLEYSENAADDSLVYKMGHALVMYLKEKGVLDDCLEAAKAGHNSYVEQLVRSNYDQKDFRDWLSQHNTETAMKEINALQVTKGEFIGTKEKIVDGEVKNVFYYKANIEKMDGESVGKFSTTSHYFTGDYLRVENSATRYCLDLSEQYRFMKLVDRNGEEKLTYCDKYGNAYKDSDEYKFHISQKIAHYEGKLQGDMIEELTYFDSSQARGMSKSSINFEHGKIYSVHSSGASSAKLMNGVSIYDGDNKIGELLTDYGYFAKVEGSDKDAFFFGDDLMGLYTRYEGGAYIAVTKESGEFTISLIDGRAVSKDGYYDKPHLHRNELLEPSINHIDKEKVDSSLLLKNTMFLDHSESDRAKEATIVKRGVLLDNKGTERAEDDVYEAKIEQDDFMYTFQNKGFYISTKGGLFIEDHGKGIRFQLPKEITHLKLVEKDGVKKLVPVTKDGNENPYGMPSNMPDEYRYIDLVFAHKYAKEDHSHKHVNIGLINFDKYRPGTIFEMRYDPNDYQIPRDANGNIIKLKHQSYFTKVKLLDEHGQEIGMLSNNFHNYTDKIFFSVDYNYSYTDFLASVAPQVNTEDKFDKELGKWTKVITFDQGKGDIGGTDRGYTDHQKIHTPANQKSQSHDEQMQGDQPVAYAQKAQMQSSNNNYRDYNVQYDKGQNSGARGKRTADEDDYSSKQNPVANNAIQPETQKPIILNFKIERGEPINEYYFSARIKLTEESKNFLSETLGQNVQFNNLDNYFNLDPKNFRIIYNNGGYRDELYVKDNDGHPIVNQGMGWPLNYHYTFSAKISYNGSITIDYGYGEPRVSGNSKLLETTINDALDNLLSNTNTLTVQDIYKEASSEIVARETKASIEAADRREQAEKEFNNKNEKLNELIDKGEVIMFEIVKGNSISGNKSIAVLRLTEKSQKALGVDDSQYSGVELDMNRFHIKEVKHGNTIVTRFYDSASGGTALSSDKALYVLDNSDSNLSGFYMCSNKSDLMKSPTKWISVKNKFNIDPEMQNILFSHLDQQNKPYASKQVADSDIHSGQQVNDHVQKAQKQYQNNSDKQFSKKGIELKKAIEKGDVVVYRVKENSNSDDKHASTTFKMIKKSKEAEANNKYMKSVKLDSKDFDIRKVEHQEGVEDGDQLFYVLYKNDHSKSGFYKLGKDEVKFNALVKFLGDPERQCTYYDNIDNKFLSSEQNNHKQQYAYKAHEEQMQSDQPKASHKVDEHHAKHEDIVLKDTILSVSKSDTADKHGRYKAEIKVKYEDIRSLYEKASSSEEQQYILDFYYKLQENGFKIGVLPQEQYYFKGNKFIIKNKNGIELSRDEGKISLQLMHLKDHQGKDHLELVVLNKVNGKVIGNIHEIDDLSYGLLRSDSDILSHLETHELQHNLQFAEHHNEYDTYLMNGLEVQIFGHVH